MAEGRDKYDIGIAGIDSDTRYRLGIVQADVAPRLAGIGRFVHTVAFENAGTQFGFAHPQIHNVGIRFRDSDGAHRRGM